MKDEPLIGRFIDLRVFLFLENWETTILNKRKAEF